MDNGQQKRAQKTHHCRDIVIHAKGKQHSRTENRPKNAFPFFLHDQITQNQRQQCTGLRTRVEPRAVKPVDSLDHIRQKNQRRGAENQIKDPPDLPQAQPFRHKMMQKDGHRQQIQSQQNGCMNAIVPD